MPELPAVNPVPTYQHNTETKRKFNISDLYWLRNLKPSYNQALYPNEVNTLLISFNADYENIRLSFSNAQINETSKTVKVNFNTRQNSANVYSEICREILATVEGFNSNTQFPVTINNYERVISVNNTRLPNVTSFRFVKPQVLEIISQQPNGEVSIFTLVSWQVKTFLEVCSFATKGLSWSLKIMSSLSK